MSSNLVLYFKKRLHQQSATASKNVADWSEYGFDFATFERYSSDPQSPTLACANITDAFSVGNTLAHTNYKVGFMTVDEAILVGSSIYGNGSTYYWLGSPEGGGAGNASVWVVSGGGLDFYGVDYPDGIRPVVSITSDVNIRAGGTGETTNPFVVS